jgi:peptidoglycan hydrolase-like protein with peptidoglycan-binding domain
MIKVLLALAAIGLLLFYVGPCKNTKNKIFQGDPAKLKEEQIIGRVQGHNPRVWEIQKILKDAHYYAGSIDGNIGKETREAIKSFQTEEELNPTGQIDQETYSALIREKEKPFSSQKTVSVKTVKELPRSDNRAATAINEKNKLESDIISYRMKNQSKTKQIQAALKNAGLYSGEIDGKMGPQTKKAIKTFQKFKGIKVDGLVDIKTWEELRKYLKP